MSKIVKFNSDYGFVVAAADFIQDKIQEASKQHGIARIALSGGSTPTPIYLELASRDELPWENLEIFQVDERHIPSTRAESNQRKIEESFGYRMGQIRGFYPFDVSINSAESASRYSQLIESLDDEDGIFDLVLLGYGDDGHTASLFPNNQALEEREVAAVAVNDDSLEFPERLTLTYSAILNCKELLIVAAGEEKLLTLDKALQANATYKQYPLRYIFDNKQDCHLFICIPSEDDK
ncbi:MAG: 6-phosphogluconolactonase [Patescibacteria group bacterium]